MSSIEWTDETWNPIVGCSKISAGCANCYAAIAAKSARLQQFPQYQGIDKWDGTINFVESQLLKPLGWKKPKKIFVCSMSDLFHENVKFEWLDRIFAVIAIAHQHTYQILTKRPERMREYFSNKNRIYLIMNQVLTILKKYWQHLRDCGDSIWQKVYATKEGLGILAFSTEVKIPLPNVWLGVSVENQKAARDRIPVLLGIPAAKRFLSCEPLLEQVGLSEWLDSANNTKLDWVICGGESGSNSRKLDINWLRSLVAQCQLANVPVFVKQLGSYCIEPNPENREAFRFYADSWQIKLKNKKGGDIDEFPLELKVRQFPAD
jgi:protein gp37